jgi:ribonucleotide monophosphatase NagD (HAD superfamily)
MQTHHIPPERILYIGDEPDLDVEGGKNMGWNTVLIRSNHPTSNGRAHFEIDTLDELHHIIFEKQLVSQEKESLDGKQITFEIEEVTIEFDE